MDYKKLYKLWCELNNLSIKQHQVDGFDWVIKREIEDSYGYPGGFLCDEMGLGKTILMIATMMLHPNASNQTTLIVVPKCLLKQWKDQIKRFTPLTDKHILIFHGTTRNFTIKKVKSYKVIITTYGMIQHRKTQQRLLWNLNYDRIIFDESHHLRNYNSIYFGALKLKSSIKWMVTGTPINNGKYDFYRQATVQGIINILTSNVQQIKVIVEEVCLKRSKKEAGIKIPDLNEFIINVKCESEDEENLIRNIHNFMNFTHVTPENVDSIIQNISTLYSSVLPMFMLMRQACVYPELAYCALKRKSLLLRFEDKEIKKPKTHSKLSAVINQVIKNKKTRKKKLIFCMFQKEIDFIKDKLSKNGFICSIINGSTSKKNRKKALEAVDIDLIKKINTRIPLPEDICDIINSYISSDVIIAQIQTCCEGLNLQTFSEIYITTPNWNPAIEDQAIARCHRIGQKNSVNVYRFVTVIDGDGLDKPYKKRVDEDGISLDQYCVEIQKIKRAQAKELGF